jgi:hypothetical protein
MQRSHPLGYPTKACYVQPVTFFETFVFQNGFNLGFELRMKNRMLTIFSSRGSEGISEYASGCKSEQIPALLLQESIR